ncbi:hypothetical protein [Terrarubrum flagellatum]|uniref:hypothetical protein n=1 Tax=Terrirubrum flagellatum TaxID=2895980 RepID=UPI003145192D
MTSGIDFKQRGLAAWTALRAFGVRQALRALDAVPDSAEAQRIAVRWARAFATWFFARLWAATPRLIVISACLGVCYAGAAIFWSENDRALLAPSIDADIAQDSVAALGEWTAIAKPIALFALESPDIPAGHRLYEARKRTVGGGREDMLTFNDFDDDALHVKLRFLTTAGEPLRDGSLFIAAVRQAAQDGLVVERMAAASDMPSKFGPVETSDLSLASGDSSRACIAFRTSVVAGELDMGGYACGAEKRPIDRAQLACLLDRVNLIGSGADSIRQAFAAAELHRRAGCGAPRMLSTGRRASWLDPDGQTPALKGAIPLKQRGG